MWGVVPAAGRGSRIQPLAFSKELLPVGSRSENEAAQAALGPRLLQVFDDRSAAFRPDDSALANLAEDTSNSVRWFRGLAQDSKPDLGIIAVPGNLAIQSLDALGEKGCRAAIVFTAGFAEVDEAGQQAQDRLTEAAEGLDSHIDVRSHGAQVR